MAKKNEIESRYLAALIENANHRIELNLPMSLLAAVVSAVQLATRHPGIGVQLCGTLEEFLDKTIAVARSDFPDIADGWALGMNPRNDVAGPGNAETN